MAEKLRNDSLKKFEDKIFEIWRKKNEKIFEHVMKCLVLGVEVPMIRIRWNKKTNNLDVDLLGAPASTKERLF